jgi:VWFA-related protein
MNRLALVLCGTLCVFSCMCGSVAQAQTSTDASKSTDQAAKTQATAPTMQANAQAVVLDMVFRDKKGKPILDIQPSQVHVYEDGTEEHLNSFNFVAGQPGTAPGAVPSSAPTHVNPMQDLRLVTLVFEGLDLDGKRFFRQALQDILNQAPEQNLYFSVYVVDQYLHCIQPFTNNREDLLKAVDKSASWSFIQYAQNSAKIKSGLQQSMQSLSAMGADQLQGSGNAGPSASAVQGFVAYQMAKMQYDMLQAADTGDREYGARSDIDSLLNIVQAESSLPGRKVVLYFNPSLFIPEVAKEQYQYMISAANRANVSFYTVDPKGLVTWNQSGEGRKELSGATGEIQTSQMAGGVGEVTTGQATVDEQAENAIRSDPRLWLINLADQTGGVAITDTNDLKAPLRTVMDEVESYYEASYDPHITVFDGKFRKITVKVDRPGVVVHSRSGYFALPHLNGGQQLYAYEMPLLNALNNPTPPTGVEFHAAAERFRESGSKIEYMVTIEAPLSGLTFKTQPDGKTALVDAPLMAVVRDSTGQIVEKFSKDFAVSVPAKNVDNYKGGNLEQNFKTELAPGTYSLEAVLMDRNASKVGVTKTSFTVPEPSSKLAMSDVVVVRRTDPLKDNQILDPFYFPGGKVVPTLNADLKGGPGNVLPFYFVAYPDMASKDTPKLTMSFYKDGQYLGSADAPLPAVQKDGRIPYIANLPADKFTPGSYEIKVGVTQGSASVSSNIDFQVH